MRLIKLWREKKVVFYKGKISLSIVQVVLLVFYFTATFVFFNRKKEIDVELAEVEPILAAARSAVGNIKSEALSEIRSLRAPPDVIHDILEGVLRLMGIQDTSWNSMKTFLAKRGVKEDIKWATYETTLFFRCLIFLN